MQMQNPQASQPPKFHPSMPPQMQAKMGVTAPPVAAGTSQEVPPKGLDAHDEQGQSIIQNLEKHLNTIPDEQKKFLAQALEQAPQLVIPFVGIVAGPEVYDYFTELYNKYFKNSAQGQQPQGQPQAAPQGQAPAPSAGPQMAPMSQPQQQSVMNPQPQAKATPAPPVMGV